MRTRNSCAGPRNERNSWRPSVDPADQQLTWTYHAVAKEIGGKPFRGPHARPSRQHRVAPRPGSTTGGAAKEVPCEDKKTTRSHNHRKPTWRKTVRSSSPMLAPEKRSRSRGRGSSDAAPSQEVPAAWWSSVAERHWPDQKKWLLG